MKKYLAFFAIILSLGFAQKEKPFDYFNNSERTKYGVFLGTNGSSIYGGNTKGIIYKMGLTVGFSAVKKLDDNLHLRYELYYINKGYKTSRIKDDEFIDKKERYFFITEYLDMPVLIQFFMPVQQYPTNWMVGLAPSINLTTRQKTKIDDKVYKSSVDDKNRLFDINLVVGTNMMMGKRMNFDLRGSAGLIPVYPQSDFLGSRNISIIASLGYFL